MNTDLGNGMEYAGGTDVQRLTPIEGNKKPQRWVTWVEPWMGDIAAYIAIKVEDAITFQRSKHAYASDEEALDDFVVCNWATITEGDKPIWK